MFKREPEAKILSLQSFLRKGVSLGHVRRNHNLKDLKELIFRLKKAWVGRRIPDYINTKSKYTPHRTLLLEDGPGSVLSSPGEGFPVLVTRQPGPVLSSLLGV